jgi:hypothetical protein
MNDSHPTPKLGDVIYCRYLDATLFRDVDPAFGYPVERECIGWLSHENNEFIRLVFERYAVPQSEGAQRETGIAVLRSAILEMRLLYSTHNTQPVGGLFK